MHDLGRTGTSRLETKRARVPEMERNMNLARRALPIIGLLIALLGLIWMGQGSGIFPYPASSFMINQSPWIWRGAIALVVGLAIAWGARRLPR